MLGRECLFVFLGVFVVPLWLTQNFMKHGIKDLISSFFKRNNTESSDYDNNNESATGAAGPEGCHDTKGNKKNLGIPIHRLDAARKQASLDLCCIRSLTQGLPYELRRDREISEKRAQFAEADRIVEAAKNSGLFIPSEKLKNFGDRVVKISAESIVYHDTKQNLYIKIKDPYAKSITKHTQAGDALFEHIIHNLLFPETRYEFLGISGGNEEVRLVLSQKEISSYKFPSKRQIELYLSENLNLSREEEYSWGNELFSITDVEPGSDNSLIGIDGRIYFIDPLIRLKQPAVKIIEKLTGIDVIEELG